MALIEISNDGPLIAASNYWDSEYNRAGKVFCSINAGAIRILIPDSQRALIKEMRTGKEVILSRGPWPDMGLPEAVELLFDDGSQNPFALHLSPTSFDFLPAQPPPGQEWKIIAWESMNGKPHQVFWSRCRWRQVARIPCLLPWS